MIASFKHGGVVAPIQDQRAVVSGSALPGGLPPNTPPTGIDLRFAAVGQADPSRWCGAHPGARDRPAPEFFRAVTSVFLPASTSLNFPGVSASGAFF
jgi:hypothetical protein